MRTGKELILATKPYASDVTGKRWWYLLSTTALLASANTDAETLGDKGISESSISASCKVFGMNPVGRQIPVNHSRGLRQTEPSGSFGKIQGLGDSHEVAEVTKFHKPVHCGLSNCESNSFSNDSLKVS